MYWYLSPLPWNTQSGLFFTEAFILSSPCASPQDEGGGGWKDSGCCAQNNTQSVRLSSASSPVGVGGHLQHHLDFPASTLQLCSCWRPLPTGPALQWWAKGSGDDSVTELQWFTVHTQKKASSTSSLTILSAHLLITLLILSSVAIFVIHKVEQATSNTASLRQRKKSQLFQRCCSFYFWLHMVISCNIISCKKIRKKDL